jgi:dipeptidase
MCDTFYISPKNNLYKSPILCKNSDREPNEAQSIIHLKSTKNPNDKNQTQKVTFIEVPQAKETYEVFLSKPFQMWGAEMGVNEYGLAIGNEAVFTKFSFKKKNNGLTGMDMIRLSLERKKTAKEALEYIIELVETYGQDACGGYENKNFYYHNSFLIVDKNEAYCLETADKFWAYKKIDGFYSISNGLTITTDYDKIHPEAEAFAKKKRWIKDKLNFQEAFSDKLYTYFSKCEVRRKIAQKISQKEFIEINDCIETLQSHGDNHLNLDSMNSLCLHSGGIFTPSETTGSMIAILRKTLITVWLTGTSHPCLSLYKPFFFKTNSLLNFKEPTHHYDNSLWWQAEYLHRQLLENHPEIMDDYKQELKEIQKEFIDLEKDIISQNQPSLKELEDISDYCLDKEKKFYQKWILEIKKYNKKFYLNKLKRPIYFYYRNRLNKKVGIKF